MYPNSGVVARIENNPIKMAYYGTRSAGAADGEYMAWQAAAFAITFSCAERSERGTDTFVACEYFSLVAIKAIFIDLALSFHRDTMKSAANLLMALTLLVLMRVANGQVRFMHLKINRQNAQMLPNYCFN